MACKYETSNGRCGLKGSSAYRHKCYTEDMCKCHEPLTNADCIRAMSDEGLAKMIYKAGRNYRVEYEDPVADYLEQVATIIDWLQQPAEVE